MSNPFLQGKSPSELSLTLPNVALLVMARTGEGKTYFLGTAPKPIVVQQFDPPDKSIPYEDLGFVPGPIEAAPYCLYQNFYSPKTGKWLIRVEYFGEANPRDAHAVEHFMARMNTIEADIREWGVRTVGLDTITFMETAARFHNKYTFHPTNKDGEAVQNEKIHYAASARFLEEFCTGRYPGLRNLCNVVLLAHLQDSAESFEEGEADLKVARRVLAAPGKLVEKIPSAFSEVYRLYIDAAGRRMLQTAMRPGNMYQCKSLRHLPDPTPAHFKAIQQFLESKYKVTLQQVEEASDGKEEAT